MNTKQLTYPTIKEQQQFWIDKEAQQDSGLTEPALDNATNETRAGLARLGLNNLPDDPMCEICGKPCRIGQEKIFIYANHVACLEAKGATFADTKLEDLSRTEATTDWYDHGRNDFDRGDLRDEGRNPDGSGLSYGERNA